ncbi:hypothetical protein ACH3XW_28945 [Acanthocheilonema viteae]
MDDQLKLFKGHLKKEDDTRLQLVSMMIMTGKTDYNLTPTIGIADQLEITDKISSKNTTKKSTLINNALSID